MWKSNFRQGNIFSQSTLLKHWRKQCSLSRRNKTCSFALLKTLLLTSQKLKLFKSRKTLSLVSRRTKRHSECLIFWVSNQCSVSWSSSRLLVPVLRSSRLQTIKTSSSFSLVDMIVIIKCSQRLTPWRWIQGSGRPSIPSLISTRHAAGTAAVSSKMQCMQSVAKPPASLSYQPLRCLTWD